jgi:hypothetical protein
MLPEGQPHGRLVVNLGKPPDLLIVLVAIPCSRRLIESSGSPPG